MITTLHNLAALAALATGQDAPPLVPAPAAWRGERIEFPLPFAPDIELAGYEQLAFAPGMFEPESDSYFSYVFGLHLEDAPPVDAALLEDFLERYYRGLNAAVAGGRAEGALPPEELAERLDAIDARVRPGGHGFVASVDLFDAFTTQEDLSLVFDVQVARDPASGVTEILALASPLPRDAEVWRTLGDAGRAWRTARPLRTYLNHLFLVPDEETYAALADSEWLAELGVVEERTTVRRDMTYTGLYVYGRHTYFEFLQADERLGPGASGVAFGFEDEGDTERAMARLAEREIASFAGQRTRELAGMAVPWFEILGIQQASESSRLNLFSLEYDPDFLGQWHPDATPLPAAGARLERGPVLARYAASLDASNQRAEMPLGDVTRVSLALDTAELAHVLAVGDALGLSARATSSGHELDGPGYELHVTPREGPGGIASFTVSLDREQPAQTHRLGKLTVTVEGRSATFSYPLE